MQAAGFYHAPETRASQPYRKRAPHLFVLAAIPPNPFPPSFNTWMGDPVRALQAREMISVINRDSLVQNTSDVGDYLYSALAALARTPAGEPHILNLRGKDCGTFISFDCASPEVRDKFVAKMRSKGVNMGGCGERAVRLRPMLVFEQKHADLLLERVQKVLAEL